MILKFTPFPPLLALFWKRENSPAAMEDVEKGADEVGPDEEGDEVSKKTSSMTFSSATLGAIFVVVAAVAVVDLCYFSAAIATQPNDETDTFQVRSRLSLREHEISGKLAGGKLEPKDEIKKRIQITCKKMRQLNSLPIGISSPVKPQRIQCRNGRRPFRPYCYSQPANQYWLLRLAPSCLTGSCALNVCAPVASGRCAAFAFI